MPAYTVGGAAIPDERSLRLRGFPGGARRKEGTVRAGNRVREQFQLDVFGEALSLFAAAARHDMLGEDDWQAVSVAASAIGKRWEEPDAGIWELDDQRWAHSRLACVAGLRAIARAATRPGGSGGSGGASGHGHREAARWSSLADAITASLKDCVHPSGRLQRAPGDERVDASLLLPIIRGGLDGDDPRGIATVEAIRAQLPELPAAMAARFESAYGLPKYDASILTATKATAAYFEAVVADAGAANAKAAANWIMGEVASNLNRADLDIDAAPVKPAQLAKLLARIADGTISNNTAKKDVFPAMWAGEHGGDADAIIAEKGLKQMSDSGELEKIIDDVLAANAKSVEEFRAGKEKAFNALVGQAMKATRGKANPAQVNELLKKKLGAA